jgi:hypothetical protein
MIIVTANVGLLPFEIGKKRTYTSVSIHVVRFIVQANQGIM